MKHDLKRYGGVVVPMVTPLTDSSAIDEAAVARIMASFAENSVQPLILGTTGEVASLSAAQKIRLVEVALREANGKMPVVAGLCGNALPTLLDEGEKYAALGVEALVALAPNYYPVNDRHAANWFTQLADKLPLPVFLYNIPATTHHCISLEVVEELSHHPNVIGIKDSDPDRSRLEESLARWKDREDFLFLVGSAVNSSYGLAHGADGIVPSVANLVPGLYRALFEAAQRGDRSEAERFQEITNLISGYNQNGRTVTGAIPALKALMSIKGLCGPQVMPPMLRMEPDEEAAYLQEMKEKILNLVY